MLLPIKQYNTVFENNFTVCLVRTPAWMDSATKNAHMRNIARFNLLLSFLFFLLLLPFSFAFPIPLPFFSFHSLRFCHPQVRIIEEYTPDGLLSCIIRLIPNFLSSFALAPLSIFFISFPLILFPPSFPFVKFSFLFLPFPFFFPSLFSSLFPSLSPSLSFSFPSFLLFFDFLS